MEVGTLVVKNKDTWKVNEFDSWDRGEGIGIVMEPPFELDKGEVDIKWPTGRCFEHISSLTIISKPNANPNWDLP